MQTNPISAAHAYRQALEAILNAPILHKARQLAARALEITFTPPEGGYISVTSGYGHTTQRPFVTIGIANPTESANPVVRLSPAEARRQALYILEAADAAESDGIVLNWMGGVAALNEQQAVALLNDFRAYRLRARGKEEE